VGKQKKGGKKGNGGERSSIKGARKQATENTTLAKAGKSGDGISNKGETRGGKGKTVDHERRTTATKLNTPSAARRRKWQGLQEL